MTERRQVVLVDGREQLLPLRPCRQRCRKRPQAPRHQVPVRKFCILVAALYERALMCPGIQDQNLGGHEVLRLNVCHPHGRWADRGPPGKASNLDDIIPRLAVRHGINCRKSAVNVVPALINPGSSEERDDGHGRKPQSSEVTAGWGRPHTAMSGRETLRDTDEALLPGRQFRHVFVSDANGFKLLNRILYHVFEAVEIDPVL
mmetsp:Transcript_45913/g.82803  ORF Transcript_45913/g.82803 Transcript_45913/m.82803 type:complete len:203 (+) Transcript_45913:115-723(+)